MKAYKFIYKFWTNSTRMSDDPLRIIIFMDSRGKGMEEELRKCIANRDKGKRKLFITLKYFRGATIQRLALQAQRLLLRRSQGYNWAPHDIIYIAGGINELTQLIASRYVEPVFKDYGHMITVMTDRFIQTRDTVQTFGRMTVICELVGMDINTYNGTQGKYNEEQEVITKGIPLLNNTINCINRDLNAKGPWLGDTIHTVVHGRMSTRYGMLADGLHIRDRLKSKWAKLFIASIDKNAPRTVTGW